MEDIKSFIFQSPHDYSIYSNFDVHVASKAVISSDEALVLQWYSCGFESVACGKMSRLL